MTRVMWLLNHRTARKFEIPMLRKIGVSEIFLPKIYSHSFNSRSADIDYSEDAHLSIPTEELAILNQTNWYGDVPQKTWKIANKYFDVLFFIAHEAIFKNIKHFKGSIIWRVYGQLDRSFSCTTFLKKFTQGLLPKERLGPQFWFGQAYEHLHEIESPYLQSRKIFLPLGLNPCDINHQWEGDVRKLFFVCPDLGFNPYYQNIYTSFCANFGDFPYVCGGAQPLPINDPHVSGFVPNEAYEENMRQFRVMFYHSTEPNHIHYHPFEAIRAGMPLVFMGGGMLDRVGGIDLPGRCASIKEARKKISRILNDDWNLIDNIRQSQICLLNPMRPENCEQAWREGFARIQQKLKEERAIQPILPSRKKRIAIIIPIAYRGGTLVGAKLLARALWEGSRQCRQDADIILAYPEKPTGDMENEFDDMPDSITQRSFQWKKLDLISAQRAMIYAGYSDWEPTAPCYITPDDGIQQFLDCDGWVIVSDRLNYPLLPIRPYVLMVYDYLQRYIPVLDQSDQPFLDAARFAAGVLVTTRFTEEDALQYAGLAPERVHKMPLLAPDFGSLENPASTGEPYFIWVTNAAPHKNHINAFKALKIYYEELGGKLECNITGVNTHQLLKSRLTHLKPLAGMVAESQILKKHLQLRGELPLSSYRRKLAGAVFLWHPCQLDNGTFSVVEAAHFGVPSLSSDYPAMEEMNTQFKLNLAWMKADNPKQMAQQLKWMETNIELQRALLPTKEEIAEQSVERFASRYWEIVQSCL